ncbi:2-dehydropantoate 2-reductase [Paenibacillus alba]|uniref:ketopantoate reductase family protein n=1 Tax=Paenibacillus alba TaxID=1197127 RepID=UPI0015663F5B|nr:2-dehydropantoate 2-reductase [Paenibacillus alba]NQX65447.1 2-dehydropantoate 2-reductase [Paenibacillus alba]
MRIMIVGAGSLGLLYAAKLAALCEHITVIARTREQAEELTARGIAIIGADDEKQNGYNASITFNYYIEEAEFTGSLKPSYDYLFLMVKQPAITQKLVEYVKAQMNESTYLVSFQNGVGHEEMLKSAISPNRLLLAVTTEGARKEGMTAVAHTGAGTTYLGLLKQEEGIGLFSHILLVELLQKAGFQAEMSNNMDVRIWSKLIINAVINPLTAIMRVQNGELLHSTWSLSLMESLYQEARIIAEARAVQLPDTLWNTILDVCAATAKNHSSMLQDILHARPTEIDRINGSLLEMANSLNLKLPTHQTVYQIVKALG